MRTWYGSPDSVWQPLLDIPEPTHQTVKREIGVILPEAPTTSTVPSSSTTTTPVQQRDPKNMIVSKNKNFMFCIQT